MNGHAGINEIVWGNDMETGSNNMLLYSSIVSRYVKDNIHTIFTAFQVGVPSKHNISLRW